jgi:TPR repeat protein
MLTSVVEKTSNPIGTVLLGVTLHDENTDPLPNGVLDRAFELVHAAALSDPRDPAYAHVVAMCYSDGIGTDVDNELALEWWRKAAAFGFVPAIESVSWAYGRGVGVPVDMIKCLNMSVTGVELG